MRVAEFADCFDATIAEVSKVLLGQREILAHCLVAMLVQGHVLIEGLPGLGKTLMVRALSHVVGVSFRRIQFTPDLMPSDITGGHVFDARSSEFVFRAGPVFTQLLLADEVNRAPAKTQSALLEAMQDRSVTTDGVTRALPRPFLVLATQNPIESQGTYPLPEAQLDRFLVKLHLSYPDPAVEQEILRNYQRGFDPSSLETMGLVRRLTVDQITEMQESIARVTVHEEILAYITEIVVRTRRHPAVEVGASPRASIALLLTAKAHAASQGREFVVPDDVKTYAPAVLRHRLVLNPDAELQNISADECVEGVLRETPVPKMAVNNLGV